MKIKNQWEAHQTQIYSKAGNTQEFDYKYKEQENGAKILVKTNVVKVEIIDLIQAHAQDTDIYKIYNRITSGNIEAIDKNVGWFEDTTKRPKTFSELVEKYENTRDRFNSFHVDFKKQFGNDWRQYAKAIENGKAEEMAKPFFDKYNIQQEIQQQPTQSKKEVKEDGK